MTDSTFGVSMDLFIEDLNVLVKLVDRELARVTAKVRQHKPDASPERQVVLAELLQRLTHARAEVQNKIRAAAEDIVGRRCEWCQRWIPRGTSHSCGGSLQ